MGKPTSELLPLLKTGNSDAARRLIAKLKKSGKRKALAKELNVPDDNGQTVIHFCAAQNFVEFLHDLADLGASIDLADNKGYTPLHLAAASGRTSAVTALIGIGADPNISSRTGDTALHLACHNGHVTSVEVLVAEKANCTMLNVSGHTPLDLACQSGHAQVVSLLLRSGQFSAAYLQRSDMPHTALMLAAKHGHNECIGLLVKHGFDVNRKLPGGNGGTALHEAALTGKVDTVRYLLQCGVDVQKTNAQGYTALDIVNMYTDPRTATIMKQVLQDALAQLARSRIAQQHAGQHAAQRPDPSTSHRNPPTSMPQPGFSYLPSSAQPVTQQASQRQISDSSQQRWQQNQPQGGGVHRQTTHPTHQSVGHPAVRQPQSVAQTTHHRAMGQSTGHPHHAMGQSTGHSHHAMGQSAGHSHHAMGQSAVVPQQSMGYSQQSSSSGHHHQSGHHVSQSHHPTSQNHSFVGQSSPPMGHRQHMGQPSVAQQHQHQHHHHSHEAESLSVAQPPPPQNVQHIYPKPGTPETAHKAPGIGGDLAAIIAAKAANRKPMVTSPTHKQPAEAEDERYSRSMTVSGEPAVQQARAAVQQRRSSFSDRSSASPERVEPPSLPRRAQAGPPAFKPVPPPPSEDRGHRDEGRDSEVESLPIRRVCSGQATDRLQEPRIQTTPSSADNELMAKLMRRQNKISELEAAAATEQPPHECEETEAVQSKPPPPPQRKTPALNTPPTQPQPSQPPPTQPPPTQPPPTQLPSQSPETAPSETTFRQKKVVKPPLSKPKEAEPEMMPWQQELAARRARMAENESQEPEVELVTSTEVQEKAASPAPVARPAKPAPKPKRNKVPPPSAHLPQELPPPPPPPMSQPQPPPQPLIQPPQLLPSTEPVAVMRQEPVVVVEESEHPAMPIASMAAIDQLSRSTSMSSLTAGTGSPQLSHTEHMPVLECLTAYKLADYAPVLEGNGYETTELMVGISHEELQEMGIIKIGHRKKLLSALSNWPPREHFFQVKPESVSAWLSGLRLSQYEGTMVEAGYDDLDFICDIALDDLHDIGITKRGHVKRLLQGVGELTELVKSVPESAAVQPPSVSALPQLPEPILPPPDDWGSDKVDVGMNMSVNQSEVGVVSSLPPPPIPTRSSEYTSSDLPPPQLPPKRKTHSRKEIVHGDNGGAPNTGNDEYYDNGAGKSFSVEDITAALGEAQIGNASAQTGDSGLDQLSAVLQVLTEENPSAEEPEPDQLLADIDDMLADLTTHLDVMIPGSSS